MKLCYEGLSKGDYESVWELILSTSNFMLGRSWGRYDYENKL